MADLSFDFTGKHTLELTFEGDAKTPTLTIVAQTFVNWRSECKSTIRNS